MKNAVHGGVSGLYLSFPDAEFVILGQIKQVNRFFKLLFCPFEIGGMVRVAAEIKLAPYALCKAKRTHQPFKLTIAVFKKRLKIKLYADACFCRF